MSWIELDCDFLTDFVALPAVLFDSDPLRLYSESKLLSRCRKQTLTWNRWKRCDDKKLLPGWFYRLAKNPNTSIKCILDGRKVNHAGNRRCWRGRLDPIGSEQPIYYIVLFERDIRNEKVSFCMHRFSKCGRLKAFLKRFRGRRASYQGNFKLRRTDFAY